MLTQIWILCSASLARLRCKIWILLIEENNRLPFVYRDDCITVLRQLQYHAFARVNPTTHERLQANRREIFPPKNQSFSSLIEIYLHLYHI